MPAFTYKAIDTTGKEVTATLSAPSRAAALDQLSSSNLYPVTVERAEEAVDIGEAEELERKIRKAEFDLEDYRQQIGRLSKMGPLDNILGMIPGLGKIAKMRQDVDAGRELKQVEAIINSMTPRERRNYRIISGSRRKRIARGSGTSVQKVNQVMRQFVQARKMMKQLSKAGKGRSARKLAELFR